MISWASGTKFFSNFTLANSHALNHCSMYIYEYFFQYVNNVPLHIQYSTVLLLEDILLLYKVDYLLCIVTTCTCR